MAYRLGQALVMISCFFVGCLYMSVQAMQRLVILFPSIIIITAARVLTDSGYGMQFFNGLASFENQV